MRAKLTIQDEVNCRFEGLDPKVRRDMIKAMTLIDPKAKYTPQGRMGRWDGKVQYMAMGGATYINLLHLVIPILEQYNVELDIEDQRISHDMKFEPVDENIFSDVVFGAGHHMEGKSIVLREHQVNAANALLNNFHGTLQAATSSGKTIICAALSKTIQQFGRSIIIVPSKDLVQQTYNDYKLVGLDAGMFYGELKELNHQHTITTWQSLNSLWGKTKKDEIPMSEQDIYDFIDGVVAVIVDEAHGAAAEALDAVLQRVMKNIPIRWGLTGTIPKDPILQRKIECNLGQVVFKITAKELQDKGILSTCNINNIVLKSKLSFKEYQDELKYLTTDRTRMKYIATLIDAIAESGNTLVLVDRLEAGELLCEFLGIPKTDFVRGQTKKKDRECSYGEIRWAENKILIATYGVASTGISISRLFNVVLIEPGKSFVRTIQSIGRGLRVAEDKNHVEIYDICGSNKFSKRHHRERIAFYKDAQYPYQIIECKDWEKISEI